MLQVVTSCRLQVATLIKMKFAVMSSYRDLEKYVLAYDLALKVHEMSLKLPKHELYEQGSLCAAQEINVHT